MRCPLKDSARWKLRLSSADRGWDLYTSLALQACGIGSRVGKSGNLLAPFFGSLLFFEEKRLAKAGLCKACNYFDVLVLGGHESDASLLPDGLKRLETISRGIDHILFDPPDPNVVS